MNMHNIVNLKCPWFLFRYPNLDIPSQALFNLHRASVLPLRCGGEDDQNCQSPAGHSRWPVRQRRYCIVPVWQSAGDFHCYLKLEESEMSVISVKSLRSVRSVMSFKDVINQRWIIFNDVFVDMFFSRPRQNKGQGLLHKHSCHWLADHFANISMLLYFLENITKMPNSRMFRFFTILNWLQYC